MDNEEKRRYDNQQQNDHDILIELQTDMKAVNKSLEKIWNKLDWQGDVRKDLDNHKKDHKFFATTLIVCAGIVGGFIGWLISYFKK